MLKLKINGTELEVPEGTTVLDACREQSIEVPTMCFLDGHEHFTSCMVCVVKNVELNRLVPACSAPVTDGMQIETNTDEVTDAQRMAIELLLSEHIGDCEGPCQVACPAQINIPAVIRRIAEGKRGEAAAIYRASQTQPGIPCRDCPGRCEKPCRRKQIDSAVAIRALMLYAAGELSDDYDPPPARPKRFNSVIGRLTDEDKTELLTIAAEYDRVMTGKDEDATEDECRREAPRCLHCDCRKQVGCKLREYAERFDAKRTRYKASERPPVEILTEHPDVIYEPGKCVRCGICVKITKNSDESLGLAFTGRGYGGQVAVPFEEPLTKALTSTADQCVEECPTGALSHHRGELPQGATEGAEAERGTMEDGP